MSDAVPFPSPDGLRPATGVRRVFSGRLEAFLDQLNAGETPNAGSFCSFCYNPLPPGFERCDHCGHDLREHPPITSLPIDIFYMHRRKLRRESLIVNSLAYLGLALGLALFLGLVAINVLYLDKAFWFFIFATIVFLVGSRLFAGFFGGVIGDEIGFRYANRRLAEDWAEHVSARESDKRE